MSTVIVGFADKMLQEEVLKQYPALAADVQDVITQVLGLANEAGEPEERNSSERHEGKSPSYGDNDSDGRRDSRDSASPSGSQALPIDVPLPSDQHDMFVARSSPEYSQLSGTPQIAYPTMQDPEFYSQLSYLPQPSIAHSLGPALWNSPKPLSPTTLSYRLTESCFNVGHRFLNKHTN
jgi:hypothetical protein